MTARTTAPMTALTTAPTTTRTSRRTRVRRRIAALGLATVTAGLAACSPPLPTPDPDAVPAVVPPAVTTEQLEDVLADLGEVVRTADSAGDATLLEPRVEGPAMLIRQAQYVQYAAGLSAITTLPVTAQTVVVPATDEWPRVVMVVTEPPADLTAPLLLTLVQDSPRSQFRLFSWARLFPGTELPRTATPELGSPPVVPGDASGLAVAPSEVLVQYADLLGKGDESAFAAAFGPDLLRAGIEERRAAYVAAVGENGTLTETYQPGDSGPYALGTADGGAIVIGTIRTVTTMTFSDSTVTFGPQTMALLGEDQVTSNLETTWLSTVAFEVPPAGSTEPIRMLGAEHAQIQVTGE